MKIQRNIRLIYWFNFSSWFIFCYPILILFFNQIVNNYTIAMSLFAVQTIVRSCLEIPIGIISDKVGRKNIMVAGAFSWVISFSIYAFANSYMTLLIGAVFYGLSWALSSGNNDSILYDTLRELKRKEDYHKIYSKSFSYLQLGLALGSLIGSILAIYSLRLVVIMSILPLIIGFIISLFIIEPSIKNKNELALTGHLLSSIKNIIKNKRLRYMALANSLHYAFNEAAFDFNSVFIKQFVPIWSLGIFRAMGHFANSLGAHLSNFFAKKLGLNKIAVIGYIGDNISNILSILANGILTPFIRLFAPLVGGIGNPAANTIIQDEINNSERATTLSVISILDSIFYSLCALLVGYIAEITSPYIALIVAYTMALISNYFSILSVNSPHISNKK